MERYLLLILVYFLCAFSCTRPVPVPEPVPPEPVIPPEPVEPPEPSHKEVNLMSAFTEDFSSRETENFSFYSVVPEKDFHYYSGFPSLTETGKTILLLRANPADDGGDNGGAIISTRDYVHYGSYSARIRMPDVGAVQPKAALFADFSLRDDDPVFGFDEFTLEFRVADKNNLYSRVSRRGPDAGENPSVQESVLTPSSSFNAASKFYVYGMDWTQDKVTWWLQTSSSSEKTILYEWTENIPSEPLKLEFRLYHDKANPALYPYELEIDWIKYTPSAI